jgi:hypothetical protein
MTRVLTCSTTFAASLLVLLTGCGGGGPSGESKTPTTLAAPAPTTAPAAPAAPNAAAPADDDAPLLAWAEGEPEEGKAPLSVEFKADIEGGKPPLKYTWKFGDGSPDSNEKDPKHTYEKAGKYRADLAVSDAAGDSDSDYVEVTVND